MRKLILFLLGLLLIGVPIFSQDLRPVGRDLSTFLEELGKETIPYLQQNALEGEGLGLAQFSDNSLFFISVTPSVTLSKGIGGFIKDEDNFELLNVQSLIDEGLKDVQQVKSLYESSYFIYPSVRLSGGFVAPYGLEVVLLFSVFPQALTNVLANMANLDDLTLSRWNAGLRVRKPLLSDRHGFPAVSLGWGYTFSTFKAGYALSDDFRQDLSGSELSVAGDLSLNTRLHTTGIDLAISKKLAFFVPFMKLSSWYQWARYSGKVEDFEATAGSSKYSSYPDVSDPEAEITVSDLSFMVTGGFELLFRKFAMVAGSNYNFNSNAFGFNFGIRAGFGNPRS